jgi:hypothetical protein
LGAWLFPGVNTDFHFGRPDVAPLYTKVRRVRHSISVTTCLQLRGTGEKSWDKGE